MPAFTVDELRNNVPESMRGLDDEDLLREYSRIKRVPFEDVANYYGMKPRGTLGEMGRQLAGGAVVDLPRMVGQGLKATGLAPEYGQELVEDAAAREHYYVPDQRADRGLVGQALTLGARGLAPMAPALAAGLLPGGQVLAPAVAAGLFGTSSYQDTYEKVLAQTGDEQAAKDAALRVGVIQGVGDAAATYVAGRALKPVAAALGGAEKTTANVARALTDTSVLKPVGINMLKAVPTEAATEAFQDVSTELVERSYGAAPEDLGEIAKQSALGGGGMALLLGPLAIGGSVRRAKNAQTLRSMLDPAADVDPAFRAQAMDVVMQEAKRQGVSADNIDQWFDNQLTAEDMRTELLRMQEDNRQRANRERDLLDTAGLEGLETSPRPIQERIDENLGVDRELSTADEEEYAAEFAQAYAQPSGLFRLNDTPGQPPVELSNGDAIAARAAGESLLSPDQVGQPVTGELTPFQQIALRGPTAPRPVTGGLTNLQQLSAIGPVGEGLTPMQQAATAGPVTTPRPVKGGASGLTAGQRTALIGPVVSTPPSAAPAAVQAPAAPVAAGALSTPVTQDGTATAQTKQAKAQGPKAPAAPQPAGIKAPEAAKAAPEAKAAGVSHAASDAPLTRALQVANRSKATTALEASVEGRRTVRVPGKASMTVNSLRAVRDALLSPTGTVDGISPANQQIADTLRTLAQSFSRFGNAGSNMLRGVPTETAVKDENGRVMKDENGETMYKPTKLASQTPAQQRGQIKAKTGIRVETMATNLQATREALAKLGKLVENNPKNVEALVAMVKDMVQNNVHLSGENSSLIEQFGITDKDTEAAIIKAYEKLDSQLSSAWNAAKNDMFRGDSDTMYVRQGETRASKEATEAGETKTQVEKAAEGHSRFGKGEVRTGVLGVLSRLYQSGTPFEQTLSKAIITALEGNDAAPKLEFIDEGNNRYDPKKHTVFIHRNASAAVQLHEALHGALQWYVYQNPNADEVVALKKALNTVVNYKGELTGAAKEVQQLLQGLVKGKRELDAVLELVSYGNTLNEFRRALEGMKSEEVPKTFYDAAWNAWQSVLTAVQKMLGLKPSVAADVIGNTFKLLEKSYKAKREANKGKQLDTAVQQTSAFKKWFGGSKVVDADGNPLVVYHGTTKDFVSFDATGRKSPLQKLAARLGIGKNRGAFFFAADPTFAGSYAGNNGAMAGGNVMPVYLAIENPLVWTRGSGESLGAAVERAARDGYDGVLAKGWDESWLRDTDGNRVPPTDVYIALDNRQIKSAIGNKGTYDPGSSNILEARVQAKPKLDKETQKQVDAIDEKIDWYERLLSCLA